MEHGLCSFALGSWILASYILVCFPCRVLYFSGSYEIFSGTTLQKLQTRRKNAGGTCKIPSLRNHISGYERSTFCNNFLYGILGQNLYSPRNHNNSHGNIHIYGIYHGSYKYYKIPQIQQSDFFGIKSNKPCQCLCIDDYTRINNAYYLWERYNDKGRTKNFFGFKRWGCICIYNINVVIYDNSK